MIYDDVNDILAGVENKPAYYHIYCYYDCLLDRCNQPIITTDEPGFMIESCKAGVLKGQLEPSKAKDLKLIYLGKFDFKAGKFEILEKPALLVDLDLLIKAKEGEKIDA